MQRLAKSLLIVTGLSCFVYVTLLWKQVDLTSFFAGKGGVKFWNKHVAMEKALQSEGRELQNDVIVSKPLRVTPRPKNQNSTNSKRPLLKNQTASVKKTAVKKAGTKKPKPVLDKIVPGKNVTITSRNMTSVTKKYVIFVCDSKRSCGGWGDRQRGLVSVYLLAYVTGRTFGVIMTKPCDVANFYIPNDVNWVIPQEELRGKSNVSIDDVDSRSKITSRLATMDFNQEYPADVVYIRTNGEYSFGLKQSKNLYAPKLPKWAKSSRAVTFRNAWDVLMKPSPTLQQSLDRFLTKVNYTHRRHPFVCAHVRVGRSSTFKTDSAVRTKLSDMPVLWNFLEPYVKNGSHLFLATDSHEVRNMTRARFGDVVHDTGGKIVHVDKQARAPGACEGFQAALLDQLVLSKCDVLVTSHSVFSHRASLMRGRDENLFTFIKGKVSKIRMNRR